MERSDIKLIVRYLLILVFVLLIVKVTSIAYVLALKGLDPILASTIIASVFAAFTGLMKYHYETNASKE